MAMQTLALGQIRGRIAQFDRLILIPLLLLVIMVSVDHHLALDSIGFALKALLQISPALLLAVVAAAWVQASGFDQMISKVFKGRTRSTVLAAAVFGALSPFCSCGVIPLVHALLRAGVPLAPVMAFWLSSPLIDPPTFFLVAGNFDFGFALAKLASAILIALLGGYAVVLIQAKGYLADPLRADRQSGSEGSNTALAGGATQWRFWRETARKELFKKEAISSGVFLTKVLIIAFMLESLMLRWLPAETVADWLGGNNQWSILSAALIGVPAYLNSLVAIPITAGLVDIGMAPGAALAFLTAGAISSIPAALAVFTLVRKSVFIWYLGLAFIGSVTVGYSYQFLLELI